MKKRIAMVLTVLGLAGLIAVGIGPRRADCQNSGTCDKEYLACGYKVNQTCFDICDAKVGESPLYPTCVSKCAQQRHDKCDATYADCISH